MSAQGFKPVRVVHPGRTQLVIVGVGGTGGYVLQQAARLLYGLKASGSEIPPVLLVDGDTVEEKNLLRQYFLPQDVGRKKADVLAERYGRAYGLDIGSYPEYLREETEISSGQQWQNGLVHDGAIVVGCVDNAATRRLLHDKLGRYKHVIYVDSGNSAVPLVEDAAHIDRYELAALKQAGWEGQVVVGVRFEGRDVLPFPGEVFPDLLEVRGDDDKVPDDPSCGHVVVSNPQRLMTNLYAATAVLAILHTLLASGTLILHRTFFDARRGWARSDGAAAALLEVSP